MRLRLRGLVVPLGVLALLAVHVPNGSTAEEPRRTTFDSNLNPIECYRSINQLDAFYRDDLVEDCFSVPALLCRQHVNPTGCIASETKNVTAFLEEVAAFPEQLPFIGDLSSSYGRAVAGVAAAQETYVPCNDQSQDVCDFLNLIWPTMSAFRAGRIAGLQRGFYPDDRFFFGQPEGWEANDPTACMIVNATLVLAYQLTVTGTCTERGMRACLHSDHDAACLEEHIKRISQASSKAERLVRSHLQLMNLSASTHTADLELLGELPLDGGVQCVEPLTEQSCTYIDAQTRLKLALDILFRVEPSLLSEVLD